MPFFARPDLSNEQFKQLSGSTLTLSGQTQIGNPVGGLAFIDENNELIPVILTGASNQDVLTYVSGGSGACIVLAQSTSGASTGVYTCKSPTTCTVGGLNSNTDICNWGIDRILQMILVPTLQPSKVEPSHTFSLSCSPTVGSTGYYEAGTCLCVTGCVIFSQGSVSPVYCGGTPVRSGLPAEYCYTTSYSSACPAVSSSLTGNTFAFTPHQISGNETYTGRVYYSSGNTVLDSTGGTAVFTTTCTSNPLPAGLTPNLQSTVCATYPYFYGKLTGNTRPVVDNALVISGTKTLLPSTGTISVSFNSGNDEYTWVAIPATSASKTCWYINALDNGRINNEPSDKYPDECPISITCGWTANYKVYMSKTFGQITQPMQFRNS